MTSFTSLMDECCLIGLSNGSFEDKQARSGSSGSQWCEQSQEHHLVQYEGSDDSDLLQTE